MAGQTATVTLSPADHAGVQAGDIIASIDGASVLELTPMGVSIVLFQHPIGGTATSVSAAATAPSTPTWCSSRNNRARRVARCPHPDGARLAIVRFRTLAVV